MKLTKSKTLMAAITTAVMLIGADGYTFAASSEASAASSNADAMATWPTSLELPKGQRPEGVVIHGDTAYVSSYVDGTIFRFDLRTGERSILLKGNGKGAIGLLLDDHGHLWVAGGQAGDLRVVDPVTGQMLKDYKLAESGVKTAVNDFTILDGNLYVTDSFQPVMYKVRLAKGDQLPEQSDVSTVPLIGFKMVGEGDLGWNSNGIVATPDGSALLIVQTNTGILFRVDPVTGESKAINLGKTDLKYSDGLHLEGKTLYAVRNDANKLTVAHLNSDGTKATFITEITDPRFNTPTTLARTGKRLYITNAHFYSKDPKNTAYEITAVNDPD